MSSIDHTNYIGHILDDRYQIKSMVGSGGMSRVFLADDLVTNRELAIKMLREDLAEDEAAVRRFIHEAKAVSMLSHPNIVAIYDTSIESEEKYIVLEYAEGITLKEYMRQNGPLSMKETIHIAVQILSALQHAHSHGIIHRDIKPQNIIVSPDGSIKLTDFGIAKVPDSDTISMTDKAIGSVHYISPEQASGKQVDYRSDLYSLGIILYEMTCNRLPFDADTTVAVACMQISSHATPPSEYIPDIPKGLEQILLKAISKRPADRFENATQMLDCLKRLEITPDAVFDFVTVDEEEEETVIPTENPDKATDDSIELQLVTPIEDTKEKKRKKKRDKIVETEVVYKKANASMFPVIFGILCGFCAVALVVVIYVLQTYFFTDISNSHVLVVGDFVSQRYSEEFKKELEENGYTVTVEWVPSSEYLAGTIISQKPEKNAKRTLHQGAPTCELTLTVSSGEKLITLPDYVGIDYRVAALELERQRISFVIEYMYSTAIDEGLVISTYPKAGTVMGIDTQITLYVSKGGDVTYVTMPNLTGATAAMLDATLKELNIRLGKVSYEYSDLFGPGLVISQNLLPGITVQAGITAVDVVVSLGPPIPPPGVTTPPITTTPDTPTPPTPEPGTSSASSTTHMPESTTPSDPDQPDEEEVPPSSNDPDLE